MVHLEAAADHVERLARETDPIGAVKEFIWNSVDADAIKVDIVIQRQQFGGVEKVTITDDGTGMPPASCKSYFDRIGGSWKRPGLLTPIYRRPIHGRTGQGRLRGFALGSLIKWTTVADSPDDGRFRTIISASDSARNDFTISDPEPTNESPGTIFEARGKQTSTLHQLLMPRAHIAITTGFAPYLMAHSDIIVTYDGKHIDPAAVVQHSAEYELSFTFGDREHRAALRIIEWVMRVDREFHLCDSEGVTVDIIETGIQAPGFDFTCYAMWDEMPQHHGEFLLAEASTTSLGELIAVARNKMRQHFKLRTIERRVEVVRKWKDSGVYPYSGEPANDAERVERETFDIVATAVHREIPKPTKHQKATLALLREAVKRQPDHVNRIIEEIFRLSPDDKLELDRLLNRTTLSSMIKAASSVADRLDFLAGLSHIVFQPEIRKLVKERTQLHRILENETWIFGEQFNLLVSDKSLDAVLDRHLRAIGREKRDPDPVRREDGSLGIVDLMLSRSRKEHDRRQHLVVELKAPSIRVGDTELSQLRSYAYAVARDLQFADVTVDWDFWLITTDMKGSVRAESHQKDRPPGFVVEYADGPTTVRIWLKSWSELIEDCKGRLQYFQEHFDRDPSWEEALAYLNHVHSPRLPEALKSNEASR